MWVDVVVWVGGPVVCAMGRVSLRVGGHVVGRPGVVPRSISLPSLRWARIACTSPQRQVWVGQVLNIFWHCGQERGHKLVYISCRAIEFNPDGVGGNQ